MLFFKKLFSKLFGLEENLFLGLAFLLFVRRYRAPFGIFEIPLKFSKCHFYARFLNNNYELEERTLISRYVKPGDHVLELGGCAGIVSCLTSQTIGDGRHCVVEANPYMLPYLYKNRDQNHCHFDILGLAVSSSKTLPFYIHENMVGSSAQRKTGRQHQIACLTLESITQQRGPFNTLIMDIEGGEYDFLQENKDTMPHFEKLVIEFHPNILGAKTTEALYSKIDALGFECVETIGTVSCFIKQ